MPLICIDTNIIDEVARALDVSDDLTFRMESLEPPPSSLGSRAYAWYWLLALAREWTSVLYTFSDQLNVEVGAISDRQGWWRDRLLALAVETRDSHPVEHQVPDPERTPPLEALSDLGLGAEDARHVADAIGMGSSHFLTYDAGILARALVLSEAYGLRVQAPETFLLEVVRLGAPWPTGVPWPWEEGPLAE